MAITPLLFNLLLHRVRTIYSANCRKLSWRERSALDAVIFLIKPERADLLLASVAQSHDPHCDGTLFDSAEEKQHHRVEIFIQPFKDPD